MVLSSKMMSKIFINVIDAKKHYNEVKETIKLCFLNCFYLIIFRNYYDDKILIMFSISGYVLIWLGWLWKLENHKLYQASEKKNGWEISCQTCCIIFFKKMTKSLLSRSVENKYFINFSFVKKFLGYCSDISKIIERIP